MPQATTATCVTSTASTRVIKRYLNTVAISPYTTCTAGHCIAAGTDLVCPSCQGIKSRAHQVSMTHWNVRKRPHFIMFSVGEMGLQKV